MVLEQECLQNLVESFFPTDELKEDIDFQRKWKLRKLQKVWNIN